MHTGLTDQAVFHDVVASGNGAAAVDVAGRVFLNACCPRGALNRGLAAWNATAGAYDVPANGAFPAFLHWNGNVGARDPTRAALERELAAPRPPPPCPGSVRVVGAATAADDYRRRCGGEGGGVG